MLEPQLKDALRGLAAAELLTAFPGALAVPLSPDQLAARLQLIAIEYESPTKARLLYDAGDMFHGNIVSVAIAATDAAIEG